MEIISKIFAVATPLFILLAVKNTPTIKGIIGELRVNFLLKRKLDKNKYLIVNNIILNIDDDSIRVDHVIISKYGVFVIETKNMNGWIFGDKYNEIWTQQIFFLKIKFKNPVRQNYKNVKFIENLLQISESKIYSIVVFTGRSEFKDGIPVNVMSINNLVEYIKHKDTILLKNNDIVSIYNKLVNFKRYNSLMKRIRHVYKLKCSHDIHGMKGKYLNLHLIHNVVVRSDIFKTICVTLFLIFSLYTLVILNQSFFLEKIYTMNNLFLTKIDKTILQIETDKKEKVISEEKTKLRLTKQNKFKGDIYSWTNRDGEKVYSNVGFPKDEPYTEGKIEINQ